MSIELELGINYNYARESKNDSHTVSSAFFGEALLIQELHTKWGYLETYTTCYIAFYYLLIIDYPATLLRCLFRKLITNKGFQLLTAHSSNKFS